MIFWYVLHGPASLLFTLGKVPCFSQLVTVLTVAKQNHGKKIVVKILSTEKYSIVLFLERKAEDPHSFCTYIDTKPLKYSVADKVFLITQWSSCSLTAKLLERSRYRQIFFSVGY